MLVQEVFEQVQAKLEKTQVAVVGAMDDFDPVVPLGSHAQVDDPDIGQASYDYQACQACWLRDVAFVQVESSALLIGEEGFNPAAFGVPMTRFADQFHTRDQVDRLFVLGVLPSNSQHRTIALKGKGHTRQVDASSWLHTHLVEGEPFAVCSQLGVLGCTADVLPSVAINGRLESNPIELPVTNENDVSSCRHYLVDLLHQLQKCDETISEEVI